MSDLLVLQSVLDAMSDASAMIGQDGTILCVNRKWRQFSGENEGDLVSHYVGTNYIGVCQSSSGEGAELARHIAAGIEGVLREAKVFGAEYPCHSNTERRWFEVHANPFDLAGERYALIAHRNVTSRVLAQDEALHAEQNAQNLAAIVATMPDAVLAFDLEGRINSWNAAAQKLYGYRRDEVMGQSMEILYPPGWPRGIKDYIADIVVNDLRHFDVVRMTRSGQLRTIAITAAPIRDPSGEVIGISNVHRDVTEEREAQQRLRSVLDNLFSFVGVLGLDGTLVEANKAPLEAAGLLPKDVIGKKFWDCYWWSFSPDTQEQLRQSCEKARNGEVVRYDVEVRVANDQLIWIDFQIAPLRNSKGEIVNLIPSGIDISERKAMHKALEASHHTFQNLVARSPFGIYTVDSDLRLAHVSDGAQPVFANVRPLIGRDFAEALRTIWPEPFATEAINRFHHTLETGEKYHAPSTIERRNDKDAVEAYDWMIERIDMPDGRPGVVCNFYDLSERQRYEEHIRLLMREVNHRSKNLLTVVMSMARQTARTASPAEFVERFSQRLYGLAASQDLIVRGNWGGVSVADLVKSQLIHLAEEIQDHRVQMEGPEMILSPSAAEGIGVALHELSTNALKYGSLSGPEGTVAITWNIDGDDNSFRIGWVERGGPLVKAPDRTGFGRTVIEKMAASAVGGRVELDYAPTGLQWTLIAPMTEVEMTEAG